uniref:Uncharacterized protein n=1 Tax=Ciona savignyi TaxID=51511 RepID=H2ZDI9_CIOSA
MLLFQKFKSKFRSITMTTVKTSPRTAADQTAREILTLLLDIREFNDADKDKDIASLLPRTMRFNNILLTDSEAHCIGRILCHREKDLDELSFSRCSLTTKRFNHIKGAVVEMKAMIGRLNIDSNNLNSVEDLCAVLHKVQNKVFMIGCFAGLAAWRYANEEETDVLQRKLDELQSPSLSIEIARGEILTARQT